MTVDRTNLPEPLAEQLEVLSMAGDRAERIDMLIGIAGRFEDVPPSVAERPFDERHRVPGCESEAFVFATKRADGTLDFHFAVENPQGISARALAVMLSEGLSGVARDRVRGIDPEIVYDIFGRELSMGKTMGLTGMVKMVRSLANSDDGYPTSAGSGRRERVDG